MLTDESGVLLLNRYEIEALDRFFPGVGYSWRYGIVTVPSCPFDLTVKIERETILELYSCEFVPPNNVVAPDDEYVVVGFEGRNPWCHCC